MANAIDVEIRGDRKIGIRFDKFPNDLRKELLKTIDGLIHQLWGRILAREPHKSGDLRSATKVQLFNDPKKVTGRVAIVDKKQQKKAGALEYGSASSDFEVKGHFQKLDHIFQNKLKAPTLVFVQAHDRLGGLAEYMFLRGSSRAMKEETIEELREAVGETIAKGDS